MGARSGPGRCPGPRDAQTGAEPAPDLAAVLAGPTPAGWARVAAIRAEHPVWPPPVVGQPREGPLRNTTPRPPVVANGLTPPPGCVTLGEDRPSAPCLPVGRAGWSCPECGAVTPVVEGLPGPRVTACTCLVEVVCLHPPVRRWAP